MKLTAVLVLVFCQLQLLAGYPQGITLSLKDARLPKVFREITKQTGYQFFYNDQMLEGAKTVSVELVNSTLVEALDLCFKDQPFTYTLDKKTVIVMRRKKNLSPEGLAITGKASPGGNESSPPVELRGKVINNKKEALIGASVKIKGISKGTATDSKGNFTIKADLGQTLVISYVGYDDREIVVSSDKNLTIEMELSLASLLNTVVVSTGYQKVSKERYVGSFSQLDSAAFNRREGMGIIERLDGTVTGVLFDKKSGLPNQFPQIRGISTLRTSSLIEAATQPLIIVDDFPYAYDLSTINTNDVESLTVLKDAAATSIWGSRAGNGVIVITTKKGKYNRPFRISAKAAMTIQEKPDLYYYPQINISDFIDLEKMLFDKGFYDGKLNDKGTWPALSPVVEILNKLRNKNISYEQSVEQINSLKGFDIRKDLDRYVYQEAVTRQYYVNLSGGSNLINYVLSAGYNVSTPDIQGGKESKQYSINSSNTFRPAKNLELQATINFNQSINKSAPFSLPSLYPYAQLADASGNSLAVPQYRMAYLDTVGHGELLDWKLRPLDEIRLTDNTTTNRTSILNLAATYHVIDWLDVSIRYQYTNQSTLLRNYNSPQTYTARDLINSYTNLSTDVPTLRNPIPIGGILDLSNAQSNTNNLRGQLNINKNWGARHALTALLASEISELRKTSNGQRLYGYNDDIGAYSSNVDYNTPYRIFGQSYTQVIPQGTSFRGGDITRFISFLSNLSYTYGGRYTVYGSARRDGANVFGVKTNNRWKPLWSAGANWDMSKESFYHIPWMSDLRLHVSYGYSGNVSTAATGMLTISYYPFLAQFTNLPYSYVGTIDNPDLRWEQVGIINYGFDFNLFNNKLSGKLDVFTKKSTDLISEVPAVPSTGRTHVGKNVASLRAKGFELNLNSTISVGSLNWTGNFGLSYTNTIVTKLYFERFRASDFIAYGLIPTVGRTAYPLAAYKWSGLDPLTGDPQGWLNGHVSKDYLTIFSDSVEHQRFYGSSIPLYFGNLGNSIAWKAFSLSANITYRLGFYFRKPSIEYGLLLNNWQGHADYSLRWQKTGDEAFTNVPSMPSLPLQSSNAYRDAFYSASEVNVLKGDNIRLQDIRFQYNWSNKKAKPFLVRSAQLFVYVNNLNCILWRANNLKLDPDFTGGSPGIIPASRSWNFGMNINL